MSIIGSNILAGASGQASGTAVYNINNSLRFRSSASAYLSRTMSASSTTFTVSCWVKRGIIGTGFQYIFSSGTDTGPGNIGLAYNETTDTIYVFNTAGQVASTAVYRDPASWYHVVMSVSSGTATVYVNNVNVGITQTSIALGTYGNIGRYNTTYPNHFDGYLADFHLIDGSALTPSSFGSTSATTGSWIPKAYSGSYGTKGFYLKFSDIATTSGSNAGLGKDFSGNANYFNTNSISVTAGVTYDAMLDVPTNTSATVANYPTLNPLDTSLAIISGANLNATCTTGATYYTARATQCFPSTGKFYFEVTLTTVGEYPVVGIGSQASPTAATYVGSPSNSISWFGGDDNHIYQSGMGMSTPVQSNGDIISVAFDAATGKVWFAKNNTWINSGVPSAGTGFVGTALTNDGTLMPWNTLRGTTAPVISANFGQRPFTYTPPTGFIALNTYNLATPTILQGNKYMDATLYTGTGASLAITNAGAFKPDLVWVKGRSVATSNKLTDSVRGVTKALISSTATVETTDTNGLTAFNSNGWTVGSDTNYNTSAATYVGWQWQANQGTTSSNNNGSIASTVSVNATAGFSIVTYTGNGVNGATIGHGLGVAPKVVIVKSKSSANDWAVYHSSLSANTMFFTNSTAAAAAITTFDNGGVGSTSITTFTTAQGGSTLNNVNGSTQTYVAYCWAAIAGFSAFGSYTGNADTNGPFVYTGFRPKWIMVKTFSTTGNWFILDAARNTYNVADKRLAADASASEDTQPDYNIDFLSNGFKLRSSTNVNISANYTYMAFAENPFQNANAR